MIWRHVHLRSVLPLHPKPSPFLLKVHSSLCQLLHASGSGEVIDKILRDWGWYKVLADDGSDAALLSARLFLVSAL